MDTADEIGQLAQSFNQMLDSLNSASSKLKESQSQLIQSEKMGALGLMTAGIAHELNNPMMGILIISSIV